MQHDDRKSIVENELSSAACLIPNFSYSTEMRYKRKGLKTRMWTPMVISYESASRLIATTKQHLRPHL